MPKFVNLIAFLQKLISKEHVAVILEFPDWFKLKWKYYSLLVSCLTCNYKVGGLIPC